MEMQLIIIKLTKRSLNLYLFYIIFLFDNVFSDVLRSIILLYFLVVVVGFRYYDYVFFGYD
jgi:hypothetical protein